MTDDVFLTGEPEAEAPATESARPLKPGFLPDGTKLLLTASRANDLADLWGQDFLSYYPSRPGEWAMLLFMGSHEPKVWRDARGELPPLMSDFEAFRGVVSEWLDTAFRVIETHHIRLLAVELWCIQNETRVEPSEAAQKKTEGLQSTISLLSNLTSALSAAETPPEEPSPSTP